MARYQVVYGNDLWSPDGYKVAYYSCKDAGPIPANPVSAGFPHSLRPLCEEIAKENGTTVENIFNTNQYLMAGGFGQYIYSVHKNGNKLFEFYALMVDDRNLYIPGGY